MAELVNPTLANITNVLAVYTCTVCGQELTDVPVLDESKSVFDPYAGQFLQMMITAQIRHQCQVG